MDRGRNPLGGQRPGGKKVVIVNGRSMTSKMKIITMLLLLLASQAAVAMAATVTFVGAGDIADNGGEQAATAALLGAIPGTIFALGDNAYPDGSASDYTSWYDPTWGLYKARTRPCPGNHDYHISGATGYFNYFGTLAGPSGQGYYSYDLGDWHIISLDSEISMSVGSAQEVWLRADLAANTKSGTLAYWHRPRFTSGTVHGNATDTQPLWQALQDYGADIVLSGHVHNYERFAPQNASGVADPVRGIREFVVGTGGALLYASGTPIANSEVRNDNTYGVLKLTLGLGTYSWQFVPIAGQTFTDAGSGVTHNASSVVAVASVTVSPASASIPQGGTTQLTATPKDAGGTPLTGRVVTWSSNNTAAATVNGSGLVSGVAAGSATITATCEGKTGTSAITVTSVPVASVTVSPALASVPAGSTTQLTATPKDGGGTPLTGRVVTWSSNNTAAATVNGSGLVSGVAVGAATITATCEGKTGTSAITVTPVASLPTRFFPADNIWNTDISTMPVHSLSATWMATVGTSGKNLHVGFYPDQYGMQYNLVDASTPTTTVRIVNQDPGDSDLIPYPFTAQTLIQLGTPDSEAFMIDPGGQKLYEMYNAHWNNGDPYASATVRWDLTSNALRADNHSSADEAGLPIFCGLFRWDEVQRGVINHAFRFENDWGHINHDTHLWPARHTAGEGASVPDAPPMGARLRLKAGYDISGFSANARVILTAMKKYGMFLADYGLDWELVGTADSGWPISLINELGTVPSSQFDFVDQSSLMIDPNSAQARQPGGSDTTRPVPITDLRARP
jgi:hypothetical protein